MKFVYVISIVTILLGCSSSSDDGDITTAGNSGDTISIGMPVSSGQGNDDVIVYNSGIYDPNNIITNGCSSPLWDALVGSYSGSIEATTHPLCGVYKKRNVISLNDKPTSS